MVLANMEMIHTEYFAPQSGKKFDLQIICLISTMLGYVRNMVIIPLIGNHKTIHVQFLFCFVNVVATA